MRWQSWDTTRKRLGLTNKHSNWIGITRTHNSTVPCSSNFWSSNHPGNPRQINSNRIPSRNHPSPSNHPSNPRIRKVVIQDLLSNRLNNPPKPPGAIKKRTPAITEARSTIGNLRSDYSPALRWPNEIHHVSDDGAGRAQDSPTGRGAGQSAREWDQERLLPGHWHPTRRDCDPRP